MAGARKQPESSVGSVGTEDERSGREPTEGRNQSVQEGRRSVADSCSSFCSPDPGDSEWAADGPRRAASSSALSELLEGLRKQRAGGEAGGTVSLPVYQTTAASALRRRASALSLAPEQPVGILKPSSPLLPRAASALSVNAASQPAPSRFNSCDSLTSPPSLPRLSSLQLPSTEGPSARRTPSPAVMEEESLCPPSSPGRSPRAPRRCVRASLLSEDPSEVPPPTEGVVFQNRRLMDADATSDILPAIRRPRSASGRRALSVHFGDLPHSPRRRGSSDAESSGSGGSAASGESARLRRRAERPRGDRLEAEGSEGGGDVAAVMRKYLNKERQ